MQKSLDVKLMGFFPVSNSESVFCPFSSFYWILWQSLYGAHFWLFNLIHLLLSLEHFLFLWQVIHKLNKLLIWRIENQTIYCFLKMHKHNLLLFHHWVPWFFHLQYQMSLRALHFKTNLVTKTRLKVLHSKHDKSTSAKFTLWLS